MNNQPENGSLSRKERERLLHRREIIDAAVHLFAQNGYEQTKLDDVAELAEFGKGTIYNYFNNKIDLFVSTVETVLEDMETVLSNRLKEAQNHREKLLVVVEAHFDLLRRNADFIRMIIGQHHIITHDLPEEHKPSLMERYFSMHSHLVQGILEAQEAGEIREGKPEVLATYLLGLVHSQIRSINLGILSIDEVNPSEIIDIFYRGVQK